MGNLIMKTHIPTSGEVARRLLNKRLGEISEGRLPGSILTR